MPTDAEWSALTSFLLGESVAGGKLKEAGTTHWTTPNNDADNSSGFTALPAGYRSTYGAFNYLGYNGYWWSSTEDLTSSAWHRRMSCSYGGVYRNGSNKGNGFTVRCLRDF